MADDIVQELHDWAYIVDESQGKATLVMLSGQVFAEAADVIERLRAAGDALAHLMPHAHLSVPCRPPQGTPLNEWCSECAALAAWEEARRD